MIYVRSYQKTATVCSLLLLGVFYWLLLSEDLAPDFTVLHINHGAPTATAAANTSMVVENPFDEVHLPGFCNQGIPSTAVCSEIQWNGTVGVQQSRHLHDDMLSVVRILSTHPMIQYTEGQDDTSSFEEWVDKTWARLSGSSVWLPDEGVYLAVTRVIYYNKRVLAWPVISFLRGRIFDAEWNEIPDYTVHWHGDEITFPRFFDIPTAWEEGGAFFGPEDPRIILEEGVSGAEPVIVFNMMILGGEWPRAMWIHRPFSNFTTILSVRDEERRLVEKNWSPFFHPEDTTTTNNNNDNYNTHTHRGKNNNNNNNNNKSTRLPSQHLHFVYKLHPLEVLRCSLHNGYCDRIFKQDIPRQFVWPENRQIDGSMNGGTNFVPVPIPLTPKMKMNLPPRSDLRVYAGFPRTHINGLCGGGSPTYRPELVLLASIGASNFHIAYASGPLDFGHAVVVDERVLKEVCGAGHIIIANSVSRWEVTDNKNQRGGEGDVMTLSLSVADRTVQIVRVRGVLEFIRGLPYFEAFRKRDLIADQDFFSNFHWSVAGNDVMACSIESAAISQERGVKELEMEVEAKAKIQAEVERVQEDGHVEAEVHGEGESLPEEGLQEAEGGLQGEDGLDKEVTGDIDIDIGDVNILEDGFVG